jgi:hypothetical protein
MLNEARRGFLPAFLNLIGLNNGPSFGEVDIAVQENLSNDAERSILDAKLTLKDEFVVVLESKVGHNSIQAPQAVKYARWLAASEFINRVLVFVTQIREPLAESRILESLRLEGLGSVRCEFLLWHQVFSLLRTSEGLSDDRASWIERRIRKGLSVSSAERLSHMFLNEVQRMTYDLCVIDEQKVGDVEDVVIQNQDPWFMKVALQHNVWFPPSQSRFGLRPTKYVAYYQTVGDASSRNVLPKHITHIARVRKVWNRISAADAKQLNEFDSLFSDPELASRVAGFRNKEDLIHMALTDTPILLARPIPLGNPRTAQFLTKKRVDLPRLLAAKSTDDLLLTKDI